MSDSDQLADCSEVPVTAEHCSEVPATQLSSDADNSSDADDETSIVPDLGATPTAAAPATPPGALSILVQIHNGAYCYNCSAEEQSRRIAAQVARAADPGLQSPRWRRLKRRAEADLADADFAEADLADADPAHSAEPVPEVESATPAPESRPYRRLKKKQHFEICASVILSSWITSEAIGLEQKEYMRLLMMRAPVILYEVLKICTATRLDGGTCDVDLVEYFCGVASHVRAFEDMGLTAVGYDCLKDPFFMNMLGTAGIVTALMLALRIRNGDGAAWLATVCSSWVWICRSGSKRSSSEPLGDADAAFVQDGNTMTARTGLIMLLMLAKRSWWLLEQPQSSLMSLHPALAYIRSLTLPWCQWHEASTYMGAYSAQSMKPTVLWSNRWWVHGLTRDKPPASDVEDTQVTAKTINK